MEIEKISQSFLKKSEGKTVKIISHHDTDGITSAAIMVRTLKRLDKRFTIKIVKRLEDKHIKARESEILLLLDLGSNSLQQLGQLPTNVFIIDHHQVDSEISENTELLNPEDKISAAGLTYLFCKELNGRDGDLAKLGVIGMVGDMLMGVSKLGNKVIEDAEVKVKKGLQLYPATRPINKALEFSSSLYIPGVTGNSKGAYNLLREAGIKKEGGHYKSLIDLNEEETSKLLTGILLRTKKQNEDLIGDIYIINFFERKKDAREISAMINACSRLGHSTKALLLCLEKENARKKVEEIYANYKQKLVSALDYAERNIENNKTYALLHGKGEIEDTIIGTVASILSKSKRFEDGKVIIAMAYDQDKLKVSIRLVGKEGRNVREIVKKIIDSMEGNYEFGGHPQAAGCLIPKNKEEEFLNNLKETLKLDVVRV